jgi:hypothetical protein
MHAELSGFRVGCYQHFERIKNLILNIAFGPVGIFAWKNIMAVAVQERDVPARILGRELSGWPELRWSP